ncbi:hypothetical protein [Desulfosediminicola flagellatus]|uniref:hypothetical protein n=1 Tax=Desulfosediminicola flagellatus TaxID=2569541 RepID=UPI0010ADA341|nr:hypothetical protein [Desulfosediminicola flagellatus]
MKKNSRCSFLLLSAGILILFLLISENAFAAGCCKQILDPNNPGQDRIINRNFNQCSDLNNANDYGDNIYTRIGRIWWDPRC